MAVNKSRLAVSGYALRPSYIFYTYPGTDIFHAANGTAESNADVGGASYLDVTTGIFEPSMVGSELYNITEVGAYGYPGEMRTISEWVSSTRVKFVGGNIADWDNDSIYVISNIFRQDFACTGIIGFEENFVSFDKNTMYIWDPNSKFSRSLPGYGCSNYKTLKMVGDYIIWMGGNAFYIWGGSGKPQDITGKIRDKKTGNAIWELLNKNIEHDFVAGAESDEGIYYISVGDLSTSSGMYGSAQSNTVLVFDTNKGSWHTESFPVRPHVFFEYKNLNGEKDLYFGAEETATIFKTRASDGDDDDASATATEIEYELKTQRHELENPSVRVGIESVLVKYRADNEVTLKMSVDGGDFNDLTDLPARTNFTTLEVKPTAASDGFDHALSFEGSGDFELVGYGFTYKSLGTLGVNAV